MSLFIDPNSPEALVAKQKDDAFVKVSKDTQTWLVYTSLLEFWDNGKFFTKVGHTTHGYESRRFITWKVGEETRKGKACFDVLNKSNGLAGYKVTLPFIYVRFTSDGKNLADHFTGYFKLEKRTTPYTGKLKFQTLVDFYEWVVSDQNPIFVEVKSEATDWGIIRHPELGYPIGVSYTPVVGYNKLKLAHFNVCTRFLYDVWNLDNYNRRVDNMIRFYEDLGFSMKLSVILSELKDGTGWDADVCDASIAYASLMTIENWLAGRFKYDYYFCGSLVHGTAKVGLPTHTDKSILTYVENLKKEGFSV